MRYDKLIKIGDGVYGKVYMSRCPISAKPIALKVIPLDKVSQMAIDDKDYHLNDLVPSDTLEVKLLSTFNHPNIIKYINSYLDIPNLQLNILTEYMPYDMQYMMYVEDVKFSKDVRKNIFKQLLSAVEYIHSLNVIHCDLKFSNVLINDEFNIKLIDFGISRYEKPIHEELVIQTLWYRAPEILFRFNNYTTKIDMWSLGCLFYELLDNKPLVNRVDESGVIMAMARYLGNFTEENFPGVTSSSKWHNNYADFPTKSREIFFTSKHKWNINEKDLFSKLLMYDSIKRISAKDALEHEYFKE